MMKYFYTLLFASLALNIFAGVPRLSRSDLQQATIIAEHLPDASSMADAEKVQSLKQFMQEHNLSSQDIILNSSLSPNPHSLNVEGIGEDRIASADAYDFFWSNDTITVNDSSDTSLGGYCHITRSPATGEVYFSFYYDIFKIPMETDSIANSATIKAGLPLASATTTERSDLWDIWPDRIVSRPNHVVVVWTLFAVPLSCLMGNDNYKDIYGHVEEDGTIKFNDDFALLLKATIGGEVRGWYLSPIFKDLTLLRPNGSHSFDFSKPYVDEHGFGHGGLVPRKPGKPVSSIIVNLIDTGENYENEYNLVIRTGSGGSIADSVVTSHEQVPVYVCMPDDTTLMVYNLFGLGNRCYLKIDNNGNIYLPRQEVYNDGQGTIYYNDERTCHGQNYSIYWMRTKMHDEYGNYQFSFDFNYLIFTDSMPPKPTISHLVNDTQVLISVFSMPPYEVHLYQYDNMNDSFYEINNSVSFPRKNEPYPIHLAAQYYDPLSHVYGEMVWFDYEVPALGAPIISLRGDVNDDQDVNISDVTSMIDGLLSGNWDNGNYDNADCNQDGEVNISDVTALIDYLLRGTWAK